MLREQQIMLVIDEAQYILSQAVQPREVPQRLSWILTSLVNYGVPVALIASRDFTRLVENMRSCRFSAESLSMAACGSGSTFLMLSRKTI